MCFNGRIFSVSRPLLYYVGSSCGSVFHSLVWICALCYAACRFSMRPNLFATLLLLASSWPCACLAAIRQKFPLSVFFSCFVRRPLFLFVWPGFSFWLGLSPGWQMVLIWLMNVLIKQNRHLARPEWPAFLTLAKNNLCQRRRRESFWPSTLPMAIKRK